MAKALLAGTIGFLLLVGCTEAQTDRLSKAIEHGAGALAQSPIGVPIQPGLPAATGGDFATATITTIVGGGREQAGQEPPDRESATALFLDNPSSMGLDRDGNLIVLDHKGMRRISPNGVATFVARSRVTRNLGTAQPFTVALSGILDPYGAQRFRLDATGNMLLDNNMQIYRATPTGSLQVVAGDPKGPIAAAGDRALAAKSGFGSVLHVDAAGDVYVIGLDAIWRIDTQGLLTPILQTGTRSLPGVPPAPVIGAGPHAGQASLIGPLAATSDKHGNVFICDGGHHRVVKVAKDRAVTVVAGTGARGDSGDGGPADKATFYEPNAVAISTDGSLMIADTNNSRVRRVAGDGTITTIAGQARPQPLPNGGVGDGGPATEAILGYPYDLLVDAEGNLLILVNGLVRKVTAARSGSGS